VGLDVAVDLGGHRGGEPGLAAEGGVQAAVGELLADAGDGVDVQAQGSGDPGVGAAALGVGAVGVEQQLGVPGLSGRGMAVAGEPLEVLALFAGEPDLGFQGRVHRGGLRGRDGPGYPAPMIPTFLESTHQ
jgi:hypothetical protein